MWHGPRQEWGAPLGHKRPQMDCLALRSPNQARDGVQNRVGDSGEIDNDQYVHEPSSGREIPFARRASLRIPIRLAVKPSVSSE